MSAAADPSSLEGCEPPAAGPLAALAYARGRPPARGRIRVQAEDFCVAELLPFEPDGDGEHALLEVEKRNANTQWVAGQLARLAGVAVSEVGYAGLKDRHGLTRQWFSVNLRGGAAPDWVRLDGPELRLLRVTRHRQKLRRGDLAGNRFRLLVRAVEGDRAELDRRLTALVEDGVPNYFGEQRFGHRGGNLAQAAAMFTGAPPPRDRHLRGLYLSAARSWLFNRVLSARVAAGSWNQALPGEVLMYPGSGSEFVAPEVDAGLRERVAAGRLDPTGPLWGRGPLATRGAARGLEQAALAACGHWREGLEAAGLEQQRRALRLRAVDLRWDWLAGHSLCLAFELPPGAYATALLRELLQADDAAVQGAADED